jgi:hypothetical protein
MHFADTIMTWKNSADRLFGTPIVVTQMLVAERRKSSSARCGCPSEELLAGWRDGWRIVILTFEYALAAVHHLAGFGNLVEVLSPPQGCGQLIATARQILGGYQATGDGR